MSERIWGALRKNALYKSTSTLLYLIMKLISKAVRVARVKRIRQLYLPLARLLTNGMSHPAFTLQPQSVRVGNIEYRYRCRYYRRYFWCIDINIDDTFKAGIDIEYRRYFWKISITTLQSVISLWPVLISRPTEGRKLSWPVWLVTYRGDIMPAWRRNPSQQQPTDSAAAGDRTNDHWVASPTP